MVDAFYRRDPMCGAHFDEVSVSSAAARLVAVETGRRLEEWPEQPPSQFQRQGVRGGYASGVLVVVLIAGGSDELVHIGEPVLELPDVESVQQCPGDDLPAEFGAGVDLVTGGARISCGHQVVAGWLFVSAARRRRSADHTGRVTR
jgi:hypothetical protein